MGEKDLDISFIPHQFVFFWWLSRVSKRYENLIISDSQRHIFGGLDSTWDFYRGNRILIKRDNKLFFPKGGEYING